MKESCHKYEGVMSHIWRSHVMHVKESCHTKQAPPTGWHLWRSHVTHMKARTGRHPKWSGLSCLATPGSAASWRTHCHMLFLRMYSFAGTRFEENFFYFFETSLFQTKTDTYAWVDLKGYMMHCMLLILPPHHMSSVRFCLIREGGGLTHMYIYVYFVGVLSHYTRTHWHTHPYIYTQVAYVCLSNTHRGRGGHVMLLESGWGMHHVLHIHACPIYTCVMSHTWISHVGGVPVGVSAVFHTTRTHTRTCT